MVAFQQSVHIGPLPAPETLREYAEIIPSSPERILGMWERQGAHRQKLENRDSWSEVATRILGLLSAVAIVSGFGYMGYLLITAGHDGAGFTALVASLAGLAAVFFVARKKPPSS